MKTVHFLGIGGSGASAIAAIAQAQGFKVSGCDKQIHNEFTKDFQAIALQENHSPDHLTQGGTKIDILAVTPAIFSADPDNAEVKAAKEQGIPVMTWQQFMGEYLEKDKFVIAVCGTHGKSTTTAMIGLILEEAGLDPTVELGAIVPKWGKNYRVGKSKYFVTEADEAYDNFLVSHPDITVVTSMEMDHPEYFKDYDAYQASFKKFMIQTKQTIITNLRDGFIAHLLKDVMKESPVKAQDFSKQEYNLKLQIPGQFNILNANAAFHVGLLLGIEPAVIRKSLENYTGIGRRFEYLGDWKNAKVYSDFAHHPTELRVNLEAIREKYPDQKIIAYFQPHMYSRTKALWPEFIKVFKNAPVDKLYILDIYFAREAPIPNITSENLVEGANDPKVVYLRDLQIAQEGAGVLFFAGAGPIHELAKSLVK